MRHNRFRELLNAGQPTLGTHLLSCWPTVVELVGHTGLYDYIEFSAEYAPFDLHDLDNLGRAFHVAGLAGMIKIEQSEYLHQAMRAIGSGFQSVLFADIRTVEDAALAVRAVRAETPATRGLHGVGMRRDVGTVREGKSLAQSLEKTGVFPDLAVEMIDVGESTGALPQMLNSVAEFFEEDVQTALTAALALIEPAILIVMGSVVVVILIALYLPIFSLGQASTMGGH